MKFERLNLTDSNYNAEDAVRRDLLPQRDDLLRQADAGAGAVALRAVDEAGRAAVCRSLGELHLRDAGVQVARPDGVRTPLAMRKAWERTFETCASCWRGRKSHERACRSRRTSTSTTHFQKPRREAAAERVLHGRARTWCSSRCSVRAWRRAFNDRTAGIGGMNHFMLPDDGTDASYASSDSMRYGAYAMEVLINEMIKARRTARTLRGEGVRRRRGARRHDDHQHRRSQLRVRAALSRAGKDPHRRRGLAGHASAQGRVHAAHRPGDGQEAEDAAGDERRRA